MRPIIWIKLSVITMIVVFLAIFVVQNRHVASVQFPFAGPCHFGLIYMLAAAYAFGILTALLMIFLIGARIKRKKKLQESEGLFED